LRFGAGATCNAPEPQLSRFTTIPRIPETGFTTRYIPPLLREKFGGQRRVLTAVSETKARCPHLDDSPYQKNNRYKGPQNEPKVKLPNALRCDENEQHCDGDERCKNLYISHGATLSPFSGLSSGNFSLKFVQPSVRQVVPRFDVTRISPQSGQRSGLPAVWTFSPASPHSLRNTRLCAPRGFNTRPSVSCASLGTCTCGLPIRRLQSTRPA